ncbi:MULTISPECIES: non-ribosomal peptide synthetase [unclassified Pseudoalteromonas]|uniref:non-ribosomal peptide synthetase n=1 Tax=unclassified Pseudoalteromonas TaxID=194690 RepID=UPI0020977F81|nr:non-ribosomal peptide synthetase [Pseudoalteromonas sp. XMcav2-N]MCO7189533.1 amino acid adenylation domain-containing protein [Pseudoalteromonas sp. XMcav2-N]
MTEQVRVIEQLIADALRAGITLYEKNGALAFKQKGEFPAVLKQRIVAHKAEIIAYFQQQRGTSLEQAEYSAIPKADRSVPLPASYAQQGLWFIEQLQGSSQYYMPAEFVLTGQLDIAALKASIEALIIRHESLRSHFVATESGQQGVSVIVQEQFETPFQWCDASQWPPHDKAQKVRAKLNEFLSLPFDLKQDLLIRAVVISDQQTHYLAFNMHHIISDGASMQVLVRELAALYRAALEADSAPQLAPLKVQYGDFATWQQKTLTSAHLSDKLAFWQQALADLDPIQSLPGDFVRPAVQTQRGRVYRQALSSALTARIQTHSAQQSVTPFMWLLSSFMLFVGRLTQNEQVVVGTPVLGRDHPDLAPLIGLFVNTVVIPANITESLSFNAWLQQQKEQILAAFEHREVPFDKVVEALNCPRDMSHHPLVQILFTLDQSNAAHALQLPGLTVVEQSRADGDEIDIKCDLELNAVLDENTKALTLNWKYDSDLYLAKTIQHWSESFEVLLEQLVKAPQTQIGRIPLLNRTQTQSILEYAQYTQTQWDNTQTLVSLFEEQVQRFGQRIAVVDEYERLSYQALNNRVNRLARVLVASKIEPQTMLPVIVTRSVNMVVTLLAILKAGAAYVPIDPDYPKDRIDYIIGDVDSRWLICDSVTEARFAGCAQSMINIDDEAIYAGIAIADNLELDIQPDHLAYMIYTSGTTGRPKGVQIEHRHVVRLLHVEPALFDFNERDVWTLFHSFCFDFSVWEMYGALLFGAKLVVISKAMSQDTQAFASCLLSEKVTVLNQTPGAFYALQSAMCGLEETEQALCQVRYVIFGGEALQPGKLKPWAKRFDACQLINMYGITETTVHVTFKRLTDADLALGVSNIGHAIPTMSCYVLDKHQQLLPMGAVGELYVGGEGVCRGYWQREELNAQRFIADPFANTSGKKLYKSGDLVRFLPDGELTYISRADDQVKVRGYRIELGEIENQLRKHPDLQAVCVLLNRNDPQGARISAFVVARNGIELTDPISQVQQYLRSALPEFMLPTNVVVVEALPLTSNGKIDKKALLALDILQQEAVYQAPDSDVERAIAQCFTALLGVDKVGLNDHFFRLGGHSLLATQLVSQLRERYGLSVELKEVFQSPRVGELAKAVSVADTATSLSVDISRTQSGLPVPLSFAQARLWTVEQMTPGSAQYHMPGTFTLSGSLNLAAFRQAWHAIIQRHEVLRSKIIQDDTLGPQQQVVPDFEVPLTFIDARTLAPHAQQQSWLRAQRDDAMQPFDLSQGLMIRLTLMAVADTQYRLRVNLHHIAADAHSLAILSEELAAFYQHFACGQPLPELLAHPLPINYADYAQWQRNTLNTSALEAHRRFWLAHLADAPPLHQLPLDRARTRMSVAQGDTHITHLDSAVCEQIQVQCRRHDVTLFTLLQTAFAVFVGKYSHTTDVVIGAPFSGREHSQLQPLVGFFINTLPIRTRFTPQLTFTELLAQQKAVMVDIQAHQAMPFEQILDALNLERSLSHQGVFQLSFALNPQLDTDLRLADIEVQAEQAVSVAAKFDIELSAAQTADGIRLSWCYNTALFDAVSIERMSQSLQVLLNALASNTDHCIADLPLTKRRYDAIKGQSHPVSKPQTVVDRLAQLGAQNPDKIALKDPQQSERLTYGELNERTSRLAKYLIGQGLKPQQTVLVSCDAGCDLVVAMLAVLKAGGAYVPVSAHYPKARIAHIIADSNSQWLLTQQRFASQFEQHTQCQIIMLDSPELDVQLASFATAPLPELNAEQLAYVIYTSGTTGQPKGVMIPHRGLTNLCAWHQRVFTLDADSVGSQTANIAFDAATWEIWPYLSAGAQLVFVANAELTDPQLLSAFLTQESVSHCFLATPIAEVMLADPRFAPASLKYLLVGGDRLNPVNGSFPFKLINNYGPTEASVVATSGPVVCGTEALPDIGLPVDNCDVYIVDEQGHSVADGMVGELLIAGLGLALGYLNRPELSKEKFTELELDSGTSVRVYRSGDLVRRLSSGRIAYIGRNDAQVKIRGYRIELAEIDHQLRAQDGVSECTVQITEAQSGNKQLTAFVVPELTHTGHNLAAQLRGLLRPILPEYMVPARFLMLEALPLTAHGKLDHRALQVLAQQAQEVAAEHPKEPGAKSNTHAQHNRILILMRELLNQPDLQPEDDFFASGGDSILAIQLASRARAIDIPVSVADIFAHSSAAALAANFTTTNALSESSAADHEQQHFAGKLRPQPIQQWFFEQAFAEPERWNQAVMLSIDKSVSFTHLCEAVQSLVACHDALRLSVRNKDELYITDQLSSTDICQYHNLSGAGVQWRDALAELSNSAQASFSFDGSPLLRLCHAATPGSEQTDRLLIIAHHLLVDGVSWRILLTDLEQACTMAQAGQAVTLPPASASLDAIAFYLQERACEGKHLERWQGTCATVRCQQALGASLSDRASTSVSHTKFQLSEAHTRQLLNEANRAYKSNIQTLLLSAWQWSGLANYQQAEQVVLLESHGRAKLSGAHDASRTIGWLTALFPLRLHSQSGASDSALTQTICAVKEQLAWATEHGCEFGALRYSHPDPQVRTSLTIDTRTQVFFNYLGQLDTVLQQRGLLGDASEPPGAMRNELDDGFAALQITAAVTDGRLSVTLECASGYYTEQDALRLSAHFEQAIETVLAHCQAQTESCPTPSDFALLPDLDCLQLQQLLDKAGQPVADIYPMTPLQQGMWFHAQSTEIPVYREQSVMLLEGALDTEAFDYAWAQLMAKHSILRTAFFVTSEQPVQLVFEQCKLPLQIDEPQHYDETVTVRLAQLAEQEFARPIELNRAPCMLLRLVPYGEHCHGFIWTYHHMIMDGWSLPVLFDGLVELYRARIENRGLALVADPFRDYVAYLETRDTQAEKAFWHSQLGHIDTPTLVTEHLTLSADKDPGVSELTQTLSTEFTQRLNQFAKHLGLTLNQVIQGAWAYWLRTCCQSDYVLFGQTISGRPDALPNVAQRVGLYINTQPVLITTVGQMSVKDYLLQIKAHQAQLTRFAHTPLAQIHQWSGIDNSSDLFDALYVFENYPNDPLAEESAPFRVKVCSEQDQTHYPITFVVGVTDQLSLTLSYSEAILTNTQASQSLNLITDLLDAFMAQPDMTLTQLPLVRPDQAAQIPHFELPGAQPRMDQYQTLQQAFAQNRAKYETNPAIRYIQQSNHTEIVLSYGELDEAACQLANYLSSHHSLGAGQAVIAVCLDSGPQLIIAILAALKLGASYLPIAPALPEKRRHYMLTNAQAAVLISAESAWIDDALACPVVDLTASHAAISAQSNEFVEADCHGESACYVIYTSGTTGEPKGVQVAHRSVLNYVSCLQSNYAITPEDNYLQFASCSFDVFAEEVFCTLLSGATLVMAEQEQLLNSQALAELSRQSKLSLMSLPTAYWHQLAMSPVDLGSAMRIITVGGEQMQSTALRAWQRHYGSAIRIINAYGPTETTISATLMDVTRYQGDSIPIGQPLTGLTVHILDKELRSVPDYVAGELYVGGAALALGYLGDKTKTDKAFVFNPNTQARCYKTGDKVRLEGGALHFLGRLDEQVKIRGYRIELGEIERALLEHQEVKACAVVVKSDKAAGDQLVAFIESHDADVTLLKATLAEQLPKYMVPQWVVPRAQLPHNNNGKLDRKALVREAQTLTLDRPEHYIAPATPLERHLCDYLAELLQCPQVGLSDDFFELGGHSLLMMRLHTELCDTLKVEVPIALLLQHPCVGDLAKALTEFQHAHQDQHLSPQSLLCLQTGSNGVTPVVLIAGAGGLLMAFQALVQGLDKRIPVYGLQPDLIAHDPDAVGSVETTALHYVSALTQAGLGQVNLIGHSFGSFIALAMARHLEHSDEFVSDSQGVSVASITILDTPRPVQSVVPVTEQQANRLMLDNMNAFFALQFDDAQLEALLAMSAEAQGKALAQSMAQSGYHFSPAQLQRLQTVFCAQLMADVYLPEQLSCPVRVVKATQTQEFEGRTLTSDMGWRALYGHVRAFEVAGGHLSILGHKDVGAVVKIIESDYIL